VKLLILNLSINNLYGKNYNIEFKKDLTILYGLNGSGKTTLLNIICNIFEGNIKQVCGYNFDNLELNFIDLDKSKKIIINKIQDNYEISLDGKKCFINELEENYKPVIKPRNLVDDLEESSDFFEISKLADHKYKWFSYDKENKEIQTLITDELKSVNELVYIPLNRKVKGIENSGYSNRLRISSTNKKNIEDSLKIAESYFNSYQNHINRSANIINSQLRREILYQLSTPMDYLDILDSFKEDKNPFGQIENLLLSSIDENINENVKKLLNLYKNSIDSYEIQNGKINVIDSHGFMIHSITMAQLSKLKKVAESDQYKKRKNYLDKQKKNLNYILESINNLFKDTDKSIGYIQHNEEHSEKLFFRLINSKEKLDLSLLSSGEKQLVIFFIFSLIEFNRSQPKLLLFDEPELSLHIEWQSKLLPLIMKNWDKKQIVIATHSPDVIGDFVSNCVEVRGKLQ